MKRYYLQLSYDGTSFFGWQRQPKQNSVQEEIEKALTKLNGEQPIQIVGCGRTDTGVHAHQYFAHFDLEDSVHVDQWDYKLNKMLPDLIAIHKCYEVSPEDHARFSAKNRTYRYFINRQKDPFLANSSWHLNQDIDIDKMNEACQYLIGKKDFTSFSKLHTDVKTNDCEVRKAEWKRLNDNQIYFEISADRFLRNMVRATVGTLVDVGLGKIEPNVIIEILNQKDRGAASTSVPAKGLFLWEIDY